MITRAFLYDWVIAHKCDVEVLKQTTRQRAVKIVSERGHYYMDLPIDETPVRHFTVCDACIKLGIEIPKECQYMQPLQEHIQNEHTPKKKRKGDEK